MAYYNTAIVIHIKHKKHQAAYCSIVIMFSMSLWVIGQKLEQARAHYWVREKYFGALTSHYLERYVLIGHVNNIPAMQFFTGISINTQSNNAMWDTHQHALLRIENKLRMNWE